MISPLNTDLLIVKSRIRLFNWLDLVNERLDSMDFVLSAFLDKKVNVQQAANMLGVTRHQVLNMIQQNKLKRIQGKIPLSDILTTLKNQKYATRSTKTNITA